MLRLFHRAARSLANAFAALCRRKQRAEDRLQFHNYVVSFIDLLGQRRAYEGQGLLPDFDSPEARDEFVETAKRTVGVVDDLRTSFTTMFSATVDAPPLILDSLTVGQRPAYLEMRKRDLKHQFWADGLVAYSSGSPDIKVPVLGIYDAFCLTGSMCFLGLAKKHPIRAGIAAGWATELYPNDLHGAAVVRAYELESAVAGYPRVVVGPLVVGILRGARNVEGGDVYSQISKKVADACLQMVVTDSDGLMILDYLGETFRSIVTTQYHQQLYGDSAAFVHDQLQQHRKQGNKGLAERYSLLAEYFSANIPAKAERPESRRQRA